MYTLLSSICALAGDEVLSQSFLHEYAGLRQALQWHIPSRIFNVEKHLQHATCFVPQVQTIKLPDKAVQLVKHSSSWLSHT